MAKQIINTAARRMLDGSELASLGIGHNSGGDVLDITSIAEGIKQGDDAGVIKLANKLGEEVTNAVTVGATTKVRALVGVAIAVNKAGYDIADKVKAEKLVKGYAPTLSGPSMAGAISYLRRAVEVDAKQLLLPTVNALKPAYDAFKGGPRKAFENAFYDAIQIAKKTSKVPTAKEFAVMLPKPVKTAVPKAKPEAPKELSIDDAVSQSAKLLASFMVNMSGKDDIKNTLASLAKQIDANIAAAKKAKPTEVKQVVKTGKKKAA